MFKVALSMYKVWISKEEVIKLRRLFISSLRRKGGKGEKKSAKRVSVTVGDACKDAIVPPSN